MFRTKYISQFNTSTPQATKRFNKHFRQYIVKYKGDNLNNINLAFETLIIEDNDNKSN
jgi:hypothetical protein